MPVILCEEEEWDRWLTGSVEEALELQRPLPAQRLAIVMTGAKQDDGSLIG
jgi:putative SOS response-associated peptidase YedK